MSAKIMLVGGGTAGHITPNLAVAHALKELQPDCNIVYVLEKHARFSQFLKDQKDVDSIRQVSAGKFRRYHGESWLIRLFDIRTILLNVRDMGRMARGLFEAWSLLRRERPDIIFIKGSFVGVPVGLAAAWLHIPFVTHDSDTLPGLANRLIGRWARYHATGMPVEFYSYPPEKTVYVGVPLSADYHLVSHQEQREYRRQLKLPTGGKVLLVAGGSNGAEPINRAVIATVDNLLDDNTDLTVVHQVGPGQHKLYEGRKESDRLRVVELLPPEDMLRYSGAADLILARAGATTIAEFAVQAKACIIVPNPRLTGGHQVKNAESLAKEGAIAVYPEEHLAEPLALLQQIEALLADPHEQQELARRLGALARPHAAHDIAELLLKTARAGE